MRIFGKLIGVLFFALAPLVHAETSREFTEVKFLRAHLDETVLQWLASDHALLVAAEVPDEEDALDYLRFRSVVLDLVSLYRAAAQSSKERPRLFRLAKAIDSDLAHELLIIELQRAERLRNIEFSGFCYGHLMRTGVNLTPLNLRFVELSESRAFFSELLDGEDPSVVYVIWLRLLLDSSWVDKNGAASKWIEDIIPHIADWENDTFELLRVLKLMATSPTEEQLVKVLQSIRAEATISDLILGSIFIYNFPERGRELFQDRGLQRAFSGLERYVATPSVVNVISRKE